MRRVLLVVALLAVGACSSDKADGKTTVVASFFAMAEVARAVAPDDVEVVDITPPGVEPHDLELTTKQVDQIEDADVVVLLGGGFQPAIEQAARRATGKVVTIDPADKDPHIWLDPVRMRQVAERIAVAIPGASHTDFVFKLVELDKEFSSGLQNCARRSLVSAHEAFGHLAARYKLDNHAVTGISPEAEPDPQRLAELADLVRRTGTTTVFAEELVSPKVAEALAREAGVKIDTLDALESGQPGAYLDVMRSNLAKLRTALSCT